MHNCRFLVGQYEVHFMWVAGIRIGREPLAPNYQQGLDEILEMRNPSYTQLFAVNCSEEHVDKIRLKQQTL